MKTSYLFAFTALFAVALVFGCIGGSSGGTNNQTNASGALKVTPTQTVAGGTITIQYTLTNSYENDMKNVQISLIGVPSNYGIPTPQTITTIVAKQQYPAIFTITAPPSIDIKQTLSPKLEVCFNYDTNYFFDMLFKTTSLATETATAESGYSTGPISVTQMGLDTIFTNTQDHVGSLQITNIGSGKITNFGSISISKAAGSLYVNSIGLSYSTCGGTTGSGILTPSGTDCSILGNALAITNGLTATVKMSTTTAANQIHAITTERVDGKVTTTYCYDTPVGTLTVCPAGKAC
jgi:hypothetical protein